MVSRQFLLACACALALTACAANPQTSGGPTPVSALEEKPWEGVYRVGLRMQEKGDLVAAQGLYLQALSKKKDYEPALVSLERLSTETGNEDLRLALQGYRVEQGLMSKLKRRAYARGLLQAGYAPEAVRQFRMLTRLGEAARDFSFLGLALDHMGKHELARVEYEKARALGADDDQLINNLALSLALSGQYSEAADILRPRGARVLASIDQNLAVFLDLAGDRKEALALIGGSEDRLDQAMKAFRALKSAIETGRFANENHPVLELPKG